MSDVAGITAVLAKDAYDGGGHRRFVVIKKSEGSVVATAAGDMLLCNENQRADVTGS